MSGFNKRIEKLFLKKNRNKTTKQQKTNKKTERSINKHGTSHSSTNTSMNNGTTLKQQKNKKNPERSTINHETYASINSSTTAGVDVHGGNTSVCSSIDDDDRTSVHSLFFDCVSTTSVENIGKATDITNLLKKDEHTRLYCVSRGNLSTPRDLLMPIYSLEPSSKDVRGYPPSYRAIPNITILQDDGISRSSSVIDFDEIEFDELSPRCLPTTRIFGFDNYGNEIMEQSPPNISYAFGSISEGEQHITHKLLQYREAKIDKRTNNIIEKYNKDIIPPKKVISDGECLDDYERHLKRMRQIDIKPKGPILEPRIRRNIQEGSYPNYSVDEEKLSRLLRYVWKGKLIKIQKYVQDKSRYHKVNREDNRGRTALHYAASWGCERTLKLLLSVPGIKVNTRDEHGKTPLYKAVEIKSSSCIILLLNAGANVKIPARDSRNPFEYAIQEIGDECYPMIHFLYNHTELKNDTVEERKLSYLHKVCSGNAKRVTKIVEMLIKSGVAVDGVEGKGRTPLILATMKSRHDIVWILLDYGANVSHVDDQCKDAFHYNRTGSDRFALISQILKTYRHIQAYNRTYDENIDIQTQVQAIIKEFS